MNFKGATIAALLAFVAVPALWAEAQERQAPVWPTKAWEISTPEAQGMDSRALARLIDDVGAYKQDSVLIVRNGKIVADAYYAPYVAGVRHDLRSVTKSFLSTAVGILVQQGKLESVDRPVLDFFPDRTVANLDERKKAITVQHLLDMASGLDWLERVYTPDESNAFLRAIGIANLRDNLALEGSIGWFAGTGQNLIGTFANSDFVYARLRYYF